MVQILKNVHDQKTLGWVEHELMSGDGFGILCPKSVGIKEIMFLFKKGQSDQK
jgi:hypothetical protein